MENKPLKYNTANFTLQLHKRKYIFLLNENLISVLIKSVDILSSQWIFQANSIVNS